MRPASLSCTGGSQPHLRCFFPGLSMHRPPAPSLAVSAYIYQALGGMHADVWLLVSIVLAVPDTIHCRPSNKRECQVLLPVCKGSV